MADFYVQKTDIYNSEEIVNSLFHFYNAVYILDSQKDCVTPIRTSEDSSTNALFNSSDMIKSYSWSQNLGDAIRNNVDAKYYKGMYAFLNRDSVSAAFTSSDITPVFKYTYQRTDGSWKRAILSPLKIEENITIRALLVITNAEAPQKSKEETQELSLQAIRYQDVFCGAVEQLYTGMIRVDITTGQAIQLRSEGNHMTEYIHRKKWDELCKIATSMVHPDDKETFLTNCGLDIWRQTERNTKLEFRFRDSYGQADGSYRWYSGSVHIICEKEQKIALLYTVDISDQITEKTQLIESSERDELTFLYNRTHLDVMLETEYKTIHSCGVLFLDINDLKQTNDLKGHKAGDELICQGAESLRILQNEDVHVYRYGGDEFIVVAPNITQEYLEKLITKWQSHLKWLEESNGIICSMAFGKAWSIAPCSVKELISVADAEMYKHKRQMKKDRVTEISLEKQELLRQHRYFLDILINEYDCIYELDLRNDHYHRIKSLFASNENTPVEGSFTPYLADVLSGKVDENDLKHVLTSISAQNVSKHMNEKHIMHLQLKPSCDKCTVWNIKVQVVEFKNNCPIKIMILIKTEVSNCQNPSY